MIFLSLWVLISSQVYIMMDLSDMDSVRVDQRGHRWLQTSMTKDEQEWLDKPAFLDVLLDKLDALDTLVTVPLHNLVCAHGVTRDVNLD